MPGSLPSSGRGDLGAALLPGEDFGKPAREQLADTRVLGEHVASFRRTGPGRFGVNARLIPSRPGEVALPCVDGLAEEHPVVRAVGGLARDGQKWT